MWTSWHTGPAIARARFQKNGFCSDSDFTMLHDEASLLISNFAHVGLYKLDAVLPDLISHAPKQVESGNASGTPRLIVLTRDKFGAALSRVGQNY